MLISVGLMLVWILYIVIELVLDDKEPKSLKAAAILVAVAYFVLVIFSLLYLEYKSV